MEIIFLGTSTAIPTKNRNHPAIFVKFNEENILIDCGEGTQRQFKKAGINSGKITRILITHWHSDHTAGLPTLLESLYMSEVRRKIFIYGPKGTKEKIKYLENIYGPFKLNLEIEEVSGEFLNLEEFKIKASQMNHGIPTNAYSIILKDRLKLDKTKLNKYRLPNSPLLQKLKLGKDITYQGKKIKSSEVSFKEKGKKISIILDTEFNERTISLAKDSDLLIAESSFLDNEREKAREYKHLTAKQAATIAKKSKSKKLALIHISQRYEKRINEIEKEAKSIFKSVIIPKDFDRIEI